MKYPSAERGGAGKSAGVVGDALLTALIFPKIRILILRESVPSIKASITPKFGEFVPKEWYDKDPHTKQQFIEYKEEDKEGNRVYKFGNGSMIFLEFARNYDEAQTRLRGREYDFVYIEEETLFDDATYDFIKTCIRPTQKFLDKDGNEIIVTRTVTRKVNRKQYQELKKECEVKVISTKLFNDEGKRENRILVQYDVEELLMYPTGLRTSTNPGNVGHRRVRDKFVRPTNYGVDIVDYGTEIPAGSNAGEIVRKKRMFIPSGMDDNKYLPYDYALQFNDLPEYKKRMELEGDFEITEGSFFGNFKEKIHVIDKPASQVIKPHWRRVISTDKGFHDEFSVHWYAVDEDGVWYAYREFYETGYSVEEVANLVFEKSMDELDSIDAVILSQDMFRSESIHKQHEGTMPADYFEDKGFPCVKAYTNRQVGFLKVHSMLKVEEDIDDNDRVHYKQKIVFLKQEVPALIDELNLIIADPNNPDEIKKGQKDHATDDFRYFTCYVYDGDYTREKKELLKPKKGTSSYVKEYVMSKKKLSKRRFL